jgi:hypothetical protein
MNEATIEFPTSRSPRSEVRLAGEVRRVDALTRREADEMYELLGTYFDGVTRAMFARDLAEKEWAVLLADEGTGRLRGFSTLMRMAVDVDGERVDAVYSGDTIVDRGCWGETLLPRLWSQHAFRIAASIRGARVFWFLICSGYKTYRFLPVFFREFYPTHERPTPDRVRRVADALASARFPREYDPSTGVVRLAAAAPLHGGVADVTERRLRDPHVAFFARANPGHARGDELVCLTELATANLTPAGRRMVGPEIAAR